MLLSARAQRNSTTQGARGQETRCLGRPESRSILLAHLLGVTDGDARNTSYVSFLRGFPRSTGTEHDDRGCLEVSGGDMTCWPSVQHP